MAEKKWYVIYTKSRAEKKVFQNLEEQKIETFLPLHKTLRQWSDRKKTVEVPLFNSYIFVKIAEKESTKVLQTNGVVCFISFGREKAEVPENEINQLKLIVKGQVPINVSAEKFATGDYVEVEKGTLKELRGYLVTYHGKHRVLVRVDVINQNLLLEIPAAYLKKVYQETA